MRFMKKILCAFFCLSFFLSAFADDFPFSVDEKEKMKKEIADYWQHAPFKKRHPHPPPRPHPLKPLNPREQEDIKKGIYTHNANAHWERRCKDAKEAPLEEWQKFLRKWHKKQKKLFLMAQNGDLHPSAANDFYLFGNFNAVDWENFRQTCHLGMPAQAVQPSPPPPPPRF